ncbi:MAG: Dps family protein [Bacilli bacterium]|jgi:starvation-inducible DNA-binding protein|nr:DNA starvation/stationary phase protection protein [Acholeplasmataceae bacterium]
MNLINNLNKAVANFGVLYTKLHSYHWFVKGNQFYQLHELFEDLYDEVTEHFDAVAERILMLNERPLATLKDFLAVTTLKEATGNETAEEMLENLLVDLTQLNQELTETIKLAQEVEDEVTVDILLGITSSFQKHIWMVKATLNK